MRDSNLPKWASASYKKEGTIQFGPKGNDLTDPASNFLCPPTSQRKSNELLSRASSKVKDSRVFVYKIIHDLRHPTQALGDILTNLIEENKNRGILARNLWDQRRSRYLS